MCILSVQFRGSRKSLHGHKFMEFTCRIPMPERMPAAILTLTIHCKWAANNKSCILFVPFICLCEEANSIQMVSAPKRGHSS